MNRHLQVAVWMTAGLFGLFGLASAARGQAPPRRAPQGSAGTESGFAVFQQRCMGCHGNPAVERAPSPAAIREMSPEKIYEALTTGVMKGQGDQLTEDQRRMTATFMSGRPLGSLAQGDAKDMPNRCASNPPLASPNAGPAWNGWGVDVTNTRFQSAKAAGLTPAQVPQLKLKWAFGYPNGLSAFGQPSVVAGRVFVGTDIGYIYSLDAKTGCVYWSYQTKGAVRNALSVGAVKGQGTTKYGVFFGDAHANVYGLDAQTGHELWNTKVDTHFVARITAAPTYYDGRLFVPVSSSEEFTAATLDYPCCTSRGSVVALDASTGKSIWKRYVMDEPKPTRKNSKGVQLYAPAGGSVWNSPTVDVKRHAVYFGTGDAETEPAAPTTDAVMAVDLDTGNVLWVYQAQAGDAFLGGCNGASKTDNCPSQNGPDLDIGNSPILRNLSNGKTVLVAATKDGNIIALDPDQKGAVVWKTNVAPVDPNATGPNAFFARLGGIVWGGAADERALYYGLTRGGMVAVQLATGERLWYTPLAPAGTRVNNSAATSAMPGVAFVGGSDGKLHALSTADGKIIWEYDTAHSYETVNKITAHGGAISSIGPTVAGGMLFVGSGYAVSGNNTGNVLLAFSAE
ncbi:MAG: PQQ-binding-like beta-propeller repeat protein [Acidobacteriia bacterium]|nr:PQQ-binding-like beta-propeller repeat protein [Terriglobia bacterium]